MARIGRGPVNKHLKLVGRPAPMTDQFALLKKLSETPAVSGDESRVRDILAKELRPLVDEVRFDKIGNIIATKHGMPDAPRIMITAHMDEIGLLVKYITDDGFISFTRIGAINDMTLINRRVVLHAKKGDLHGVIGTKPPHLRKKGDDDEKGSPLFIDVGAKDRKAVGKLGIAIGTYVSFDQRFENLGANDIITGKALDGRLGCYVMIEAMRQLGKSGCTVYAVGTVQEAVGLKGARVAAFSLNPDAALVLDVAVAGDFPAMLLHESPVNIGEGPVIMLVEGAGRGLITHPIIRDLLVAAAGKLKIKHQVRVSDAGITDAGSIYLTREGIPSGVISIPCRYIHSPIEVASMKDVDGAVKLLVATIKAAEKVKDWVHKAS